ncbi:MAG: sigma-70 family RNA polymerase sigma factor [Cruoricaptor ignavus]|nr:sigma-70 family RNA polymerase sigma factor [Cruoricaptor ignavus]MDO5617128.1 sigma-70 family RNA polymerase sigma factor [Cruoricaptor ignavus]
MKTQEDFQSVFENYFDKVTAFVSKTIPCKDDVQDVVQNTFLHVWNYFQPKDSMQDYEPVIFKTAKQEISNYYRKNKAKIPLIEELDSLQDVEDEQDQNSVEHLRTIITDLLSQIPKRRAKFFILNKVYNISYAKIAEHHKISKTAVEKQVNKTVAYLKANL